MQAFLLGPSGPTGGGGGGERGLFRRHRKPPIFLGRWRPPPANHTPSPVTTAAVTNDGYGEDHYSVLGLPRRASSADVKKAYRLLALKLVKNSCCSYVMIAEKSYFAKKRRFHVEFI
ncbi:hypothetical protein QJS10_CPB18g00904 [Acorus calamus]|uniref:J domain-containing protein n=1 Tax=Acorus calamus TaxID=4465 RepID=A0AAV9CP95_ACOCL|nr:hypothetical protein QJS10_CPB18g00904 [Acorus calamus]